MSDLESTTPYIPEELNSLAISLESWLSSHQEYQILAVGALIFGYRRPTSEDAPGDDRQPHLLLIKRSENCTHPGCWEVPGGSVESGDPTILYAVAREVSEEAGLRLTRFIEQIGGGVRYRSQRRKAKGFKLSFEIEIAEIPAYMTIRGSLHARNNDSQMCSDESDKVPSLEDIPISLNPTEHQAYEWVTEEDLKIGYKAGKYSTMEEELYQVMLTGFARHKAHLV
ncbi:MAG: hypothetical protein M1813_006145 [Trichoglossum hirsutum]|jgi:8-oxo-dGTP pyrophosphatase MutT (NUDIX family)|nr:MAG: hypothetical protein M1813_006145 [Trichoglossum hirsutum]